QDRPVPRRARHRLVAYERRQALVQRRGGGGADRHHGRETGQRKVAGVWTEATESPRRAKDDDLVANTVLTMLRRRGFMPQWPSAGFMPALMGIGLVLFSPIAAQSQACLYPRPSCGTWFVSEFGLLNAFENQLQAGPVNAAYWEVGFMKRLNARSAIGLSAYATYDDTDFRHTIGGL